jgi:twinkle protein
MLSEQHAAWLEARGIDLEVATNFGLTTTARRRDGRAVEAIKIPYTRKGRTVNHKYRLFGLEGFKWDQDSGAEACLWNNDVVTDKSLHSIPLVICEGEWDALTSVQCGYVRTVCPPNGCGMKMELAEELKPHLLTCKKIILAGDGDVAGQNFNAELARRIGPARCYFLRYPEGCKDVNEVWNKHGGDATRALLDNAVPFPIAGIRSLSDYPPDYVLPIFPTGFPGLNPFLKLFFGELMVVTGVPSHGKSRFTVELVGSMSLEHGHSVAIASPEMRVIPYVRDILREHCEGVRVREMTEQNKAHADIWINRSIHFIDAESRDETADDDLNWYVDRAADCVFRHGIRWWLLDPWNQVSHRRERYESSTDYQSRAFRLLREFAKKYDVGIIVVAHPTKSVAQKDGKLRKPTPYDIDGSAHWYNSFDHCLTVWKAEGAGNVREIQVTKCRHADTGHVGSAFLKLESGRLQSTVDSGND